LPVLAFPARARHSGEITISEALEGGHLAEGVELEDDDGAVRGADVEAAVHRVGVEDEAAAARAHERLDSMLRAHVRVGEARG